MICGCKRVCLIPNLEIRQEPEAEALDICGGNCPAKASCAYLATIDLIERYLRHTGHDERGILA